VNRRIAWTDVQEYLRVVRHAVEPTAERAMLHVFILDNRAKPQFPLTVRKNAELRGTTCDRFLRDIHLDFSEFQALVNGRLDYEGYLALLKSGRLL
jgi:hypothetical protein